MIFNWEYDAAQACWKAEMPDGVCLVAVPERYAKGFTPKPARGTKWRASVSRFDGKFTVSRYGRDTYSYLQNSAKEAMRLAETVYKEAQA